MMRGSAAQDCIPFSRCPAKSARRASGGHRESSDPSASDPAIRHRMTDSTGTRARS